jgi:hypothetical protein
MYWIIILAIILLINLTIGSIKTLKYLDYLKEIKKVEAQLIRKMENYMLSETGAKVYIAIQEYHLKYYTELVEYEEYQKNKVKYFIEDTLVSSVTWPFTDIFKKKEKAPIS